MAAQQWSDSGGKKRPPTDLETNRRVWWLMSIIISLGRMTQEGYQELEDTLGYKLRPYLKKKK